MSFSFTASHIGSPTSHFFCLHRVDAHVYLYFDCACINTTGLREFPSKGFLTKILNIPIQHHVCACIVQSPFNWTLREYKLTFGGSYGFVHSFVSFILWKIIFHYCALTICYMYCILRCMDSLKWPFVYQYNPVYKAI